MPANLGYTETRRSIRMSLEHPARIVEPTSISAQVVNISMTGVLLHTLNDCNLMVGSRVSLAIPHDQQELTLRGQVVRVESAQSGLNVAINLVG